MLQLWLLQQGSGVWEVVGLEKGKKWPGSQVGLGQMLVPCPQREALDVSSVPPAHRSPRVRVCAW